MQFLRAQYQRAEASLTLTAQFASGNELELAWVDVTRGACRHNTGDYAAAGELLRSGVERSLLPTGAAACDGMTMLGRYHLFRGEIDDAVSHLDWALEAVKARGMTAFVSWPEAFRGEIDLIARRRGRRAGALPSTRSQLGCQVGDACWESIGLRGLGLVAAARGGPRSRARASCRCSPSSAGDCPDTYLWIEAYALDALCAIPSEHRVAASSPVARRDGGGYGPDAESASYLLRAMVYRAQLGDPGAVRRCPLVGRADRQPGA